MTTLRGDAQEAVRPRLRVSTRALTMALIAVLAATVLALAIALAATGGSEESGTSEPVRVAPSTPLPPSPAERDRPPGLNGPGMRP
jgi:hypothetical protein